MPKRNEGQLIIKARNKFFQENPELLELHNLVKVTYRCEGQYLKNRLEKAFIAGWDAARKYKDWAAL